MRSRIARVTIKIIEVLGCIACFITKIITDLEARRVFLRNQKYSREWSLLHNVTWSSAGNTFANITYGGFSLITTLMLISRCIDANSRPSVIEKIFLVVGMLSFFAMGGLVLAAFDQVPWELHDNSIILGCLSFFVALVMMYDLADPLARHVSDTTQTESNYSMPQQQQPQQQQQQQPPPPVQPAPETSTNVAVQTHHETTQVNPIGEQMVQPTKPAIDRVENQTKSYQSTSVGPAMPVDDIAKNGNYHKGDTIDFVQMHHMPTAEQPVFERVLLPEKKRPTFNKVADPHNSAIVHNVHPEEYVVQESPHRRRDHFESTMHYTQMPKYAAIQRQQSAAPPVAPAPVAAAPSSARPPPQSSHHFHDPVSLSYAPPPSSASMYKLSRSYEHNDYERPPPKHSVRMVRSDAMSRYHDAAPEHYQNQPPMMVIRNYSQPMSTRTAVAPAQTQAHSMADRRHHQPNDSVYHRSGSNGIKKQGAQMNARKSACCASDNDEVDFRKMNSAIRPGFVATVAKMWDKRAVENSGEFNTIV